jgi:uncharacterized membrane protein
MRNVRRFRRKVRRSILRLIHILALRRWRLAVTFRRYRSRLYAAAGVILLALACWTGGLVFLRNHVQARESAEALSTAGTLSQVGIAVGAAMLGVIGIVFSLSLFSIQQVAERGTSLTLREYANDWVLRAVFWSLAAFTVLAMGTALLGKHSAIHTIVANFLVLVATILLLKLYFNRAIKFSDPHFTVTKIAGRARKSLSLIRQVARAVEAEVRHERRRGRD